MPLCCCKHTEIYKLFFNYPHLINVTSRKAGIMIYLETCLDRMQFFFLNLKQEFSLLRRFVLSNITNTTFNRLDYMSNTMDDFQEA